MDQPVISNVFGTLGATCWSIQLIPQIVLNYRRHSAAGLSTGFMLLWSLAGIFLGSYNIVSGFNLALQIQPQILSTLSLITMGQGLYYERNWRLIKVSAFIGCMMVVFGSIEYAFVYALQIGIQRETEWPKTLMSALAATLLVAGVAEQYVAIYKNKSVEGISFLFCGLDALGDITSLISVIFEPQVNIAGSIVYATELLFWLGIFALGFYYKGLLKSRKLIRTIKAILLTYQSRPASRQTDVQDIQLDSGSSSTSVFRLAQTGSQVREREARRPGTA